MSDRGLPIADGAHACPFVAFEEDRDERASVPDHRHRCYADTPPAPRALAHQEAYCLSSAFPVCPTFQDWARRESAKARGGSAPRPTPAVEPPAPEPEPEPEPEPAPAAGDALDEDPEYQAPPPDDEAGEARRNPPRDWSAPPPWLASSDGGPGPAPAEPPYFLASRSEPGQGLAGSTADRWAGGPPPTSTPSASSDRAAAAAAAATAAAAAGAARPPGPPGAGDPADDADFEARDLPRPATPRRPRAYDQHLGGSSGGPDWEKPRRYEAFPTIRTRVGLPNVPRIAVMVVALAIAALALFFLPAFFGLGSPDGATSSPTPTASPSRSIAPTPTPAPTPVTYVIKGGDTLSKIAVDHGLTLDALMAANPEIKDPNRITVGQQIIIPVPEPSAPDPIPGSAAPSAGASP